MKNPDKMTAVPGKPASTSSDADMGVSQAAGGSGGSWEATKILGKVWLRRALLLQLNTFFSVSHGSSKRSVNDLYVDRFKTCRICD